MLRGSNVSSRHIVLKESHVARQNFLPLCLYVYTVKILIESTNCGQIINLLSFLYFVCLIDLRFNISVENAVSMHVFYGFQELIDVELDTGLWQIRRSTLDCLIQIHFHELEDES